MYDIGILGGMGPKATAVLYQLLVDSTVAHCDQEHLNIAVISKSGIPDRSAFLLGQSTASPLPALTEGIQELNALEARYILMPCNTAHYFYPQLAQCSGGYIINMVSNALHYISRSTLPDRVYVLGTLGTVQTGIYDRFNSYGLQLCYPSRQECENLHRIIYEVKENSRELSALARQMENVICSIRKREEAVTFAIACTELSCLYPYLSKKDGVVDVMMLAALAATTLAGGKCAEAPDYDLELLAAVAKEDAYG